MDSQPTIDVDASGSTFYHADRDLVNQRIELHQQIDIHIHPSPISTHSMTLSGPLPSTGVHFWGQFHRPNLLPDLTRHLVTRESTQPVAIGEHADLWIGKWIYKKVAVKVFRGGSSSNPDFLQKFKERLEREARVWQHLKNPNVSDFYGLAFNFGYMPALILPFYGNGAVVEYVKEKNNIVKLDMVRRIAQGMNYLHEQSVIHGDLRGSNILVDEEGLPRICDYGLAFILEPSEFSSIKTAGACRWAAPEIMDPPEDVKSANDSIALFTKESDIYAFSMTALEIFTSKPPFNHQRFNTCVILTVREGGRPDLPPFLKEQKGLRELVQECWHQEPRRRPPFRAVNQRLIASTPEEGTASGVGESTQRWFRRFVLRGKLWF